MQPYCLQPSLQPPSLSLGTALRGRWPAQHRPAALTGSLPQSLWLRICCGVLPVVLPVSCLFTPSPLERPVSPPPPGKPMEGEVKAPPLGNPDSVATLSSPTDLEPPGCSKEVWEARQKRRLTAGRERAACGTEAESCTQSPSWGPP